MAWLKWVLLEEFLALAPILFTVNFILLVYWRRSNRPQPLLIGLGVAVLLLVLQAVVVTQREHAIRILTPIERDFVDGRVDALAAQLAPGFQAGSMDVEEFVDYAQRGLQAVHVRDLTRERVEIERSEGDRFVALAAYRGLIETGSFGGLYPSRWSLTFVKTDNGWMIGDIEPVSLPGLENTSWQALSRRW